VHIKSKFKTIADWLTSICNGKKPDATISEFDIDLGLRQCHVKEGVVNDKPDNEYIVSLYGVNTSLDEKNQSYTRIEFWPSTMYFKFPKKQYKDLTYEQMKNELTEQIKKFILKEEFRNSFLSQSNIKLGFDAKPIWVPNRESNQS
jgi:hypothetical protein